MTDKPNCEECGGVPAVAIHPGGMTRDRALCEFCGERARPPYHFHVGSHVPGYSPDTPYAYFGEWEDARDALEYDADDIAEGHADIGEEEEGYRELVAEWEEIMAEIGALEWGAEFYGHGAMSDSPHDIGRALELIACAENCEEGGE